MFDFPAELNVEIKLKEIEVDIPKLTFKDKEAMSKWELQPKNKILISDKRKTRCTKIIKGGNEELRIKYLLVLLERLNLFTAPPPPTWDVEFLQNFDRSIKSDDTQEAVVEKLKLADFAYFNLPKTVPKFSDVSSLPVKIGTCTASYVIYTFCRPEDYSKFTNTFSDPEEKGFVVQMKLPVPTYVSVQHNFSSNNYTFAFTSIGKIEAATFQGFFKKIIENMEKDYSMKMTVKDGEVAEMKYLVPIAEKYGLYVAAFQDLKTIEDELARSFIYVLSRKGAEDKGNIVKALKEMFETVRLYYCLKCKSVYPITNKVCFRYFHSGKRIPFPDGEMEIVDCDEVDEYDEPTIIQNWSCCGELPDYELGCQREPNGEHERDMKHKEITTYKLEQSKFSREF